MLGAENFLANPHRPLAKAPRSSKALLALEDAAKVVQTRALAPPNAVTVTFGWSAAKVSLKVSAKNTHGMAGCAPPAHRAGG